MKSFDLIQCKAFLFYSLTSKQKSYVMGGLIFLHRIDYIMTLLLSTLLCIISLALAEVLINTNCTASPGKTCKYTACPTSFQLNTQGQCITSLKNSCAIYSANSILCDTCQPTYRSINGTCIKDMTGCAQYRGTSCLKCGFGKQLSNKTCIGTLNCMNYTLSACSQCYKGYFLNRGVCFTTDVNCQKIDYSSGACMRCMHNHTLIGYECVPDIISINDCYVYNSKQCLICKAGYLLFNGTCIIVPTCPTTFYLSPSYKCVKLPQGCRLFDSSNATCKECYPNYQITNQACVPALPPNCFSIDSLGNCNNCSSNYYSSNFSCRQVSPYCGRFNNQGKCLTCKINTFVNVNGLCKDPFCINMIEQTCLQCKNNFAFSQDLKKCILVDPNCVKLTETACLLCYNHYYISYDICKPLPSDCLSASPTGACLQCERDYYLQFDACFPINNTIPFCRIYSQITNIPVCLQCQLGYMVSLGRCLQIVPFCTLMLSNGNCVSCMNGYRLTNNTCLPTKRDASDPNCANMTNRTCVRCNSNAALGVNGVCYNTNNTFCTSSDTNGCLKCERGMVITRGICVSVTTIDVNCRTYNKNQCLQCYQGYYLINNQCRLPNFNCSSFNLTDGGCLTCFLGFTLTNKQCVIVTKLPNCLSYNSFGNCLQCARMFYITNNTCNTVNPLCQNYNSFNGDCTSCFPGYALKGKTCIKQSSSLWSTITNITAVCKIKKGTQCIECPYRYYLRQNTCILVSSSCATYNINGNCLTCSVGYFLKNNNCINYGSLTGTDPNCRLFRQESYCLQCYNGFVSIQGQCQSVDPLCRTYDNKTGRCTACYEGYTLSAGTCQMQGMQTLNPCIQQNLMFQCTKCIASHYLSGIKCLYNESMKNNNYNIPFCQIATNSTFCTLCNDGFYARQGVCYQVSTYCQTYDPNSGKCLTCKPEYIFQKGDCIFPAMGFDAKCVSYQGVYCFRCIMGYYLKDYVCTLIDKRCIDFNYDINQCLKCSTGIPNFDVCQ